MDGRAAPTRPTRRLMAGPASGSATRLLILGGARIFQPVHGYFLRRELLSWNVDEWASVHPGSIYNALRSLTRSGLLEEVQTSSAGARPARTTYRLTDEGEREFFTLVHTALRAADDPTAFLAATTMSFALTRAEVVDALEDHAEALGTYLTHAEDVVAEILAVPEKPDHATEIIRIISARTAGEHAWTLDYLQRLRAGAYSFADEPPDWRPTPAQVTAARKAGAHPGDRPAPSTH